MNMAIIINEYPPNIRSGVGRYAQMGIKYINEVENTNISVFTTNTGYLPKREEAGGIRIYRPMNLIQKTAMKLRKKANAFALNRFFLIINVFFNNFQCYRLVKKCHSENPFDVIAVHSLVHSISGILCGLSMDVPIVFHKHSGEFTRMPDWWRRDPLKLMELCEKIMEKRSAKIIVLTEEMYKKNLGYGISADKLRIVPHGYEVDWFQKADISNPENKRKAVELKKNLKIGAGTKVIVYVGRLTKDKGVFSLIRAIKPLIEQGHNLKLLLVGSGQNPQVCKLIKKLGLENAIYAYCKILDTKSVLYHYLIADICVLPSVYKEPFGLVATESMSFGIPTLLGDGFSRLFAEYNGRPCVLYADGRNPADLAKKISYLLDNKAAAREMAENGKQYVEKCLSWSVTAHKTVDVYNEAIFQNDRLPADEKVRCEN